MDILKKEYVKQRDKILSDKKTTDLQKSGLLFNNWHDYISGSTPEETRIKNLIKNQNEMNFVRI
jgi:uncharacterized protein YeeX (DUF496 family)